MRGEPFRGTFFKQGPQVPAAGSRQVERERLPLKVERVTRKREGKRKEEKTMDAARKRDGYCRFPKCGCKRFGIVLDVAHFVQHRGIGGNPAGDRTTTDKLISVCRARHRGHLVSIDRHTLRVRTLTRDGADGPCAFDVDMRELGSKATRPKWLEVGRETSRHNFEPFTEQQLEVLERLAEMAL